MQKKTLNPPFYLNVSIFLMAAVHYFVPLLYLVKGNWKFLGVIPLILGIALNLIADKKFKNYNTTVKPGEESHKLITEGVFKYSRNPMYFGMVCILIGFFFFLGSLSSLIIIPNFMLAINYKFISLEEQMLEMKFQEHWLDYKNKVHKWI